MGWWDFGRFLGCMLVIAGIIILMIFLPYWAWLVLAGIALMVLGIFLFRRC